MSLPVDLDALRDRIAEYGETAFLVTVNEQGTAHVVSAALRYDGDRLVAATGRSTRANIARTPDVTLLWSPGPDPAYCMIVDATAVSVAGSEDQVAIEPGSAVLHRVAGAPGTGPTCLPVSEPITGARPRRASPTEKNER